MILPGAKGRGERLCGGACASRSDIAYRRQMLRGAAQPAGECDSSGVLPEREVSATAIFSVTRSIPAWAFAGAVIGATLFTAWSTCGARTTFKTRSTGAAIQPAMRGAMRTISTGAMVAPRRHWAMVVIQAAVHAGARTVVASRTEAPIARGHRAEAVFGPAGQAERPATLRAIRTVIAAHRVVTAATTASLVTATEITTEIVRSVGPRRVCELPATVTRVASRRTCKPVRFPTTASAISEAARGTARPRAHAMLLIPDAVADALAFRLRTCKVPRRRAGAVHPSETTTSKGRPTEHARSTTTPAAERRARRLLWGFFTVLLRFGGLVPIGLRRSSWFHFLCWLGLIGHSQVHRASRRC